MCGICGKLNFDRDEPVALPLVRQMMRRLEHRGPDGSGEWSSGPVGLGHRRLSIIDLATGSQPMSNEDGSVQVVYNGEIYNFAELRRELVAQGHRFRSSGDTEVIVHLYEQLGDRCVERLKGMFAFALWDAGRSRLLLARDRLGIKPLYYADTGRSLVFASEIRALLADPAVGRDLDAAAVERFLMYYYLPGERTLLRDVRKLPPGHILTVEDGRASIRPYWDLRFDTAAAPRTFDEAAQGVRERLECSVREHLISDVPVGVLLSGGVDSTAVLHFASRHAATPLHSFTIGFDAPGIDDERPFARLASRAFGSEHHETTLSAAEFRDLLPHYVGHMEEPVCEPPAIALHVLARLARQTGVKVLLSGEGGDEAFAGYPEYRNLVALEQLKEWFGPAKGALGLCFNALRLAGWSRGGHYAALVDRDIGDYYYSRTSTPLTAFNRLRHARSNAWHDDSACGEPTRRLLERMAHEPLLNRLLYVDTKTWLPDDLLVKADKMTMAASVELRVPLLDHELLEYAASLPPHYKRSGWTLKRVLREALRPLIPREILERRKAGFPVPYARWLRHELHDYVRDTLLSRGSFCECLFSRAAVERLLSRHAERGGGSKEVFSLLVLELWHQQFLGPHVAGQVDDAPAAAAALAAAA